MNTTEENRMKSWRINQSKSGKKRMDIFVTEGHHEALKNIRQETKESYGDIIGRLLNSDSIKPNHKTVTIEIPEKVQERLLQEYEGVSLVSHLEQMILDEYTRVCEFDENDTDF